MIIRAIPWLHAVFKPGTTFDLFYECERMFLTLHRKLSQSLAEILPQDLKDRLSIKEVEFH